MLCQNCGKNEATTHIKRIVNGESTQAHLCTDCAKSLGYYNDVFSEFDFNFSDMLGSFFNMAPVGAISSSVLRCEKCGSTFNDIVRSGKIGCADCYSTFYDKLLPSLERIHGRTRHVGKCANHGVEIKKEKEITDLKSQLQQAVEKQDYEKAAQLRDKIKEIESEGENNE